MSSTRKEDQNSIPAPKQTTSPAAPQKQKRIRRGKQQIILDKIKKSFKNIPDSEMEEELSKIEEILNALAEKNGKSNKLLRYAKGKSNDELDALIAQLQSMKK